MVINYVILVHKQPEQLKRLVDRLYDKNTYFFIHIDRQVDSTHFERELKNKEHVYFLQKENRVKSLWGSSGVIKATLALIKEVVQHNREGYTVLLSGQCYPLKSNSEIRSFFENGNGNNFIEGFKLPDPLWPDEDIRLKNYSFFSAFKKRSVITVPPISLFFKRKNFKLQVLKKYLRLLADFPTKSWMVTRQRKMPKGIDPYGGMAYWALPLPSLKFIMKYIEDNPAYLKYHDHTLYPDEVFFQTIIYNFLPNNKPPVTFAYWPTISDCSPKTFTYRDCQLLLSRSELFARKFDANLDDQILNEIDYKFLKIPSFNENKFQS